MRYTLYNVFVRTTTWMRLTCPAFLVALVFLSITVHGQSVPLDLRSALAAAAADNLEIRAARQQRAMALAGLQTARQFQNPIISFGAARDTPHESLLWDQIFELGGKRGKRIALAREEQAATELDISILSRQIRQRTRQAFYAVIASREQTGQAKAALDLATRLRDIVQQRFDAGDVAEIEVIQADVELARATAEYETAAQAQKTADAQLAALLNFPVTEAANIQGRLSDIPKIESLQAANDIAMRSNTNLQRATEEVQLEQRRLQLARAQRIPNVEIQAGADLNSPNEFSVGPRGQIAVSVPLFYHGQGEVGQSTSRLEFLRLTLQALRTNASADVAAAYFDYLAKAHHAEQYVQKIVPQSVKLQEMAEDSYRSGKSNLLTLIDAQRKLNETRKTYLDSLLAVQSSFATLEEVVGAPLD
jgi:outer membrane protein, heavy metal efflux system